MNNPIEDLGKMMRNQMREVANANKGLTIELGRINNNMSLSVASLGNAIPSGDYMVSLRLTIGYKTEDLTIDTKGADGHTHELEIPEKYRGIKPGDRVLVAWAGTEPIVIDIVVSS